MPPIIMAVAAAVGGAINVAIAGVASVFTAIGVGAGTALTLAGAIVNTAIGSGLSWVASKLFAPKQGQAVVAQRQASVLQLNLGEQPRCAAFGRLALGGRLVDAFNYGADFEWEVMVIALCDHESDVLEQFMVNDRVYTFTASGLQTHADFMDGATSCLEIQFRSGTLTQTPPAGLVAQSGGRWTSDDTMKGVTHVWVAYKFSEKVWPTGRPAFKWIGRWKKCYDARKDSTVAGGSGAHRWNDPSTHEWTQNAYVNWYNFQRGVWTNGQLIVGPGRGEDEQPAARMIAPANACDEAVTLKAGGTEPRYQANALVRADERWVDVAEDFALAMAGEIVERDGGWEIDVGVVRTVALAITDADLLANAPLEYQAKVGRADLVNSITATYVSPSKLYEDHSAPLRRSSADITADGEARERSMALVYVHRDTQAQRVAEIARRKARRMRQATIPLSMRFMGIEVGDWCEWTSDRYLGGQTVKFQVVGVGIDPQSGVSVALREIHDDVFGWVAATDELDALSPAYLPPGAPGAASVAAFAAAAFPIIGADAVQRPGVKCTFTVPTDPTVVSIRFDWRPNGGGQIVSEWTLAPFTGEHVIATVPADVDVEVRATPETTPQRTATTTAWQLVHTPVETVLVQGYLTNESHTVATASDGSAGDYSTAGGTFKVLRGIVDKSGAGPVYSVVGSPTGGLSISIGAGTGIYTVTGMTSDLGQATLRAVYAGVTVDRVYSLAKSKAGAGGAPGSPGAPGSSAKALALAATAQIFTYDGAGAVDPSGQSITFTATGQNLVGSPSFSASPAVTLTGAGSTRALSIANFGANTAVEVTVTWDALTDKITVVRVQDGAAGSPGSNGVTPTTGYLTNESHTVATANDGSGGDYSTAGGTFKVFNGVTDVTTSATFSVVGTPTGGLSISIGAGTGIYTVTGMTSDLGQATLRAVYAGTTIDKVYSLAKAKSGTPGTPGGVVSKSSTVIDNNTGGATHVEIGRCAFTSTASGGSWRMTLALKKELGGTPTAVSDSGTFNGSWELLETATGGSSGATLATGSFTAVDDGFGLITLSISSASSLLADVATPGARDVIARVWRASGSNDLYDFTGKLTVEYIPPA